MPEPLRTSWRQVKRWLLHYFYGLFAKSWNGSISAVDAFIGLAVGAAVSPSITAINWQGVLAVFLTTYARTAVQYFKDHPIPEQLDHAAETAAPFAPVSQLSTLNSQPGADDRFAKLPEPKP